MFRKAVAGLVAALFLAGLSTTLVGCNTMEGAGQDLQATGKAIKDEARENKKY